MQNSFVWTDLSTFDLDSAQDFYRNLLGWSYQDLGEGYLSCEASKIPVSGLYTMPEKFQNIGMPPFWMSYIQVSDLEQTVGLAEQHGAKVEVRPTSASGGGQVALIRDPSGAGFTCYQGDAFSPKNASLIHGTQVWNELHVSDLTLIKDFYEKVFDWRIEASDENERYQVFSQDKPIAGIQVTPNEIKGDKEYWGVYFLVDSLDKATVRIQEMGGELVGDQPMGDRRAVLAYDNQGAAFYLVEPETQDSLSRKSKPKWRAILGLCLVVVAVITEMNWIWGALFLSWVIPDIYTASTHFFEPVQRKHNPIIYWLIIGTWLLLSVYMLFWW
ncbi:VOC family protein [Vibrio ishigakensis]|nr:VOC family protein [Vibrio ishigakensis]